MAEIQYFFSYARKDSEFVLNLAKELRAIGVNLWLDQLDILGGQRWDRAVEGALETCQGMLVVLSPESLASNNVMDEVSYALEEGKLVVPILFRSCAIPFRLRRVQYIDFTASYETGFTQLLKALHINQPLQPREPATPEEAVVHDVMAPSEEMPQEAPRFEQQLVKTELTAPEKQVTHEIAEPLAGTLTDFEREPLEAQTTQRSAPQPASPMGSSTTVPDTLHAVENIEQKVSTDTLQDNLETKAYSDPDFYYKVLFKFIIGGLVMLILLIWFGS